MKPVISDLHPRELQVCGGDILHIFGENFNTTENGKPRVSIGGKNCDVIRFTNSTIECSTPSQSAGEAIVVVHIPGRGSTDMYGRGVVWESKWNSEGQGECKSDLSCCVG